MATLLDGRALAASLRHELKAKVAALNHTPRLGVVLVGNDPASHLYVSLKEQAAAEVGIAVEKVLLLETANTSEVVQQVTAFNERADVHSILIQLPLPPQVDEAVVITTLDPTKDADGFHPDNLARFLAGQPATTPGVAEGIMRLIDLAGCNLTGKNAVLVVNSHEFAQPLVKLLKDRGVRTSVITQPDTATLRAADIIVVAVGHPGLLHSEQVKDGAIVIDVGTTKVGERLLGDAAPELYNRNIFITPVPGGVGPMTIAMLLTNVYQLAAHAAKQRS